MLIVHMISSDAINYLTLPRFIAVTPVRDKLANAIRLKQFDHGVDFLGIADNLNDQANECRYRRPLRGMFRLRREFPDAHDGSH